MPTQKRLASFLLATFGYVLRKVRTGGKIGSKGLIHVYK